MGDRTTVRLTVLLAHREAVNVILEANDETPSEKPEVDGEFVDFLFYEVNYGVLDSEADLQIAGTAYTKSWDAGGDYSAGTDYCRYSDTGELQVLTVYDDGINPDIGRLTKLLDHPTDLRMYIVQHIADTVPLPWDNQEQYGKLYQTTQLIAPTP